MENQNWKCKECSLVCGTPQGIRSHWERKQKKGEGHEPAYIPQFAIQTSEPVTNPGWYGKQGTRTGRCKKKETREKRMSLPPIPPMMTSSDGPLVIYPLVIRGDAVVHPGSFGIVAVQRNSEEFLLEALINEHD